MEGSQGCANWSTLLYQQRKLHGQHITEIEAGGKKYRIVNHAHDKGHRQEH
jgi:hypothetical protein